MKNVLIATRWAFTNPRAWQAAQELIRRGYTVNDSKRHLLWEWVAINTYPLFQSETEL